MCLAHGCYTPLRDGGFGDFEGGEFGWECAPEKLEGVAAQALLATGEVVNDDRSGSIRGKQQDLRAVVSKRATAGVQQGERMGKKRKGETRGKDKKRRRRKKNLEKVWLNQSPVSPGMKLVSAELRNVRSGRFERRKVMVDSCSEVSMATRDFLEPICGSLPITVKGVHAVAPSRITGHAGIKVGVGNSAKLVMVHCVLKDSLPGGACLLLSDTDSAKLGLRAGLPSRLDAPMEDVPDLTAYQQWFNRTYGVGQELPLGTIQEDEMDECVVDEEDFVSSGPASVSCASVRQQGVDIPVSSSISSRAPLRARPPLLKKDFEEILSSGAAVPLTPVWEKYVTDFNPHCSVAEATVQHVLQKANSEPFKNATYSVDDIQIGVTASKKACEASGIPGVQPGGVLTLQQARQLRALFVELKDAFASSKVPKKNNAPPVEVELEPDDPAQRYPSKPSHVPPPVFKPQARYYLDKLRVYWLENGLITPRPHSRWASRLHLVGKGAKNGDGLYEDIRVTDDNRGLNKRTLKYKKQMPDGVAMLEKASEPCYCSLFTDVTAAFNGFGVAENSRELFTVYLPAHSSSRKACESDCTSQHHPSDSDPPVGKQ